MISSSPIGEAERGPYEQDEARRALHVRRDEHWTKFETALYNLVTLHGDRNFSRRKFTLKKRLRMVQAMLDAYDETLYEPSSDKSDLEESDCA
jgi:hypothetical protein